MAWGKKGESFERGFNENCSNSILWGLKERNKPSRPGMDKKSEVEMRQRKVIDY